MAIEELHVADSGAAIKATIKENNVAVDISTALTTKRIIFKKPNSGIKLEKDATFFTDGTDGILQYLVESGVLDEAGTWRIQGFVVLDNGDFYSDIKTFKVHPNL
jgi:hypothetical protein